MKVAKLKFNPQNPTPLDQARKQSRDDIMMYALTTPVEQRVTHLKDAERWLAGE